MADDEARELPYLSEGKAPEGQLRNWGYRLRTQRGDLFLAPLAADEIYVSSDCLDVEGLADKRGRTGRLHETAPGATSGGRRMDRFQLPACRGIIHCAR